MKEGDLSWLVRELSGIAGDLDAEQASAPLLLAIDQGGHASRVIAFDVHGVQHAESFTPISTFRSGADRIEHDAREVVDSIRTALDDIAQTLGADAERVLAAGMATQRSSIVCWDRRSGKPLSPVLSWQDRRNAALVEKLRPDEDDIRRRTGLVLSPHYGASKLRWCLDELDEVHHARDNARLALGPLAAYLLFCLLTERPYVVDPANASRTQLWDLATRRWSDVLGRRFGVPLELLPRVVHTRDGFGSLAFAGRDIPFAICTGDQSAALFAFGPIERETVYLNIGTGAFLQRPADIEDPRLLHSLAYSDEQQLVAVTEGTVNGAASALDWLNERVGIDAHRAALAMKRSGAGNSSPLFINGIGGVGSPYWCADLQSRFIGEGTEALQVQAVVESIAFLICRNLERICSDGGVQRIRASGGLSASDYLCECIAALSELAVERTTLREATSLGLAFLIAGQPGNWSPPMQFERIAPRSDDALRDRYRRWCEEMDKRVDG